MTKTANVSTRKRLAHNGNRFVFLESLTSLLFYRVTKALIGHTQYGFEEKNAGYGEKNIVGNEHVDPEARFKVAR